MLFASVKEAYNYFDHHNEWKCSGCSGVSYLSHSHIIPRSECKALEAETNNITFHCLSVGGRKGCHEQHEGMNVVFLNDFLKNFEYIFHTRPSYFWQRFFKLSDYWNAQPKEKNALPLHMLWKLNAIVTNKVEL